MAKKHIILFILEGLPLLIYPLVLMVNVMTFGTPELSALSKVGLAFYYAFLLLSTLYPVVFIYAVVKYIVAYKSKNQAQCEKIVWLPLKCFGLIVVLYINLGLLS